MKELHERHAFLTRWTHWINFPIMTIMIWSGLFIYWANDAYGISMFGFTLIKFFPQWFYDYFHIPQRLAEGMAYHFLFMWFFFINGALYICYTIFSGAWRDLLPKRNSSKEAWQVLLHDLHLRRTMPPQKKYNAAQRIAYTTIILIGVGSVVTGLAIYKPVQFSWLCWICGGYNSARILHFAFMLGYVVFFVIHLTQVVSAGWNTFRSMISGFELRTTTSKDQDKNTPDHGTSEKQSK